MVFGFKAKPESETAGPPMDESLFGKFANLPKPFKETAKQDQEAQFYQDKLVRLTSAPIRLLEEATRMQASLNRMKMRPAKRLELTRTITGQVYPAVSKWYDKFQKEDSSLPEGHERRNALTSSIAAIEQIAHSYKELFSAEYSVKPAQFNKHRSELSLYALRVLELLRVLQRLKALRYQRMSKVDWLDVNQAFFSMLLHNAVDDEQPLLGSVGVRVSAPKKDRASTPTGSILDIYLSIQLFGMLGVDSWPTRLFYVPDAYLETLAGQGLKILADNRKPVHAGFLITYLCNPGPALFERSDTLKGPAILFDYTLLYNALVKDHENLAKMKFIDAFDPVRLSKPLQKLADTDRVPILESMLLGLKHRTRQQKRHQVITQDTLRVYFGRDEVMRLLRDLSSGDARRILESRQFVDKLAEESTLLTVDGKSHLDTQWRIINFSSGGLLIGTEETAFSTPIAIGQLVAFSPVNAELQRLTLAYTNRLNRSEDGRIEVALVRLSTQAEAAIIQTEQDMQDFAGHHAILVKDMYGHWQLVVTSSLPVKPGDPLKLIRKDGNVVPVRLGELWLAKKEFTMYELRSPGLR